MSAVAHALCRRPPSLRFSCRCLLTSASSSFISVSFHCFFFFFFFWKQVDIAPKPPPPHISSVKCSLSQSICTLLRVQLTALSFCSECVLVGYFYIYVDVCLCLCVAQLLTASMELISQMRLRSWSMICFSCWFFCFSFCERKDVDAKRLNII